MNAIPAIRDIQEAAGRIQAHIHQTPILKSAYFNQLFHTELFFKCENFQKAGAFKSRGAVYTVFGLNQQQARNGVATHSSGNHAQALARAAAIRGIPAHIVMPSNANPVKVEAVKQYGGLISFCGPTLASREESLSEVMAKTGAEQIHPYDDYRTICGQATCALEVFMKLKPDILLCPLGGGGLLSGTLLSRNYLSPRTQVIAVEPAGADDGFRSFQTGHFVPSLKPDTIADGLLTSMGKRNYPIIMKYVDNMVTVDDDSIIHALHLIMERMKMVVEPSAATVLAALLQNKIDVKGKKVALIISGGNLDIQNIP